MKKINYALCLLALILTGCNNNNTSTSGKGGVSSSTSTSDSTNVSTKPSTSTSTSVIKTLKEISIEDYPLKTEYEINETLSVDGVTLRLTYTDETSEVIDVTMDMVTVPDMSKVGIASVVITYKGFSASYNISIKNSNIKKEKPTISFVVDNNPFENGTQFVVNAIKNIEVTVTEGVQYNVYYTKDDGATNLGNVAPTEVGKYAINVVTIENDSYESVSDFRWYEIVNEDSRITPTFKFSIESGVMFVEGNVPEITASANEEGVEVEIYYTKDDGATNLGGVAPTTPGTYAINIKSIANDTYKEASDFRWYIIKPATAVSIEVQFSEETSFTYDGKPHTPTVVSITNNVSYKVHYEKGEKFYSNDAPVEEGTYSMVVSLVNDSDGTLVRPWWCTFTITKD